MKRPHIAQAQRLCEALKARGVIVLAFTEDDFAGASYGETKGECRQVGQTLDTIVEMIAEGEIPVWSGRSISPDPDAAEAALSALRPFAEFIKARHAVFGRNSQQSYPELRIDHHGPDGRIKASISADDWDRAAFALDRLKWETEAR